MCGRNTYFAGEFSDLRLIWNVDSIPLLKPRFNIAPSQEAPVIFQADGKRSIELFQWGLIQSLAKDPAIGNKMINARAETLTEKPSFKRLSDCPSGANPFQMRIKSLCPFWPRQHPSQLCFLYGLSNN